MNEDLKPCPFCGGKSDIIHWKSVVCDECLAGAPESIWNTRANRWAAFTDEELYKFVHWFHWPEVQLAQEVRTELERRK